MLSFNHTYGWSELPIVVLFDARTCGIGLNEFEISLGQGCRRPLAGALRRAGEVSGGLHWARRLLSEVGPVSSVITVG